MPQIDLQALIFQQSAAVRGRRIGIDSGCLYFFIGWWKLRKWLQLHSGLWPPVLPLVLALLIASSVTHNQFALAYGNFRTLVGGKKEAVRVTLAHQVYAAYRRHNVTELQK